MKSLRVRLSVFLLLAAVVTALPLGVLTYLHTLRQNEALFDYQLRQTALSLRDQGWVGDSSGLIAPGEEGRDIVVQIWTMNGAILYLSHPDNPLPDRATLGFSDLRAGARLWRVYCTVARDRVIQVAQPLELRRDLAAAAALRSLTPLLAFLPIMALLIWYLVGISLGAVKRLARDVERRDARALEPVAEQGAPSEIAPLVHALNALLERLKRAFSAQRAFVADAAHELRSPLTALKLQLQMLDRAPDQEGKQQALRKLHEGVDRASRLIEQLLTAARTDPQDAKSPQQHADLAELTRLAIAEVFPLAQAKSIALQLDAPEHALLRADPALLQILVRNLVDNAVRYTPSGGVVDVAVVMEDDGLRLVVDDSGPGIPEAERERVFDRFYRREQNDASGSGLGLSIVRNIARQHGAEVSLSTSRLGGLKALVVFMAQEDRPSAAASRPLRASV